MAGENQNPSAELDPADLGNMAGMMRMVYRKLLQSTDGMLPAKVIAVTPDRRFVTVQPQIMVLATDLKTTTPRAQIAKVPVLAIGAGDFVQSFPIKPGDFGWIWASDRDISLYIQAAKEAKPNTLRLHSFEDAIFCPEKAREFVLADEDADAATWQSLDGTIKITLGADRIHIVHPTLVEFTTPLVKMSGDLEVEGTITGKTDVIADTISGKTHEHDGGSIGSGDTGPPNP